MVPGLSNFVNSTWKKYKEDTNKLTTWVVLTAKGCDSSLTIFQDSPGKGPRLKGKARKLAKLAAVDDPKAASIPVARLNQLASVIVKSTTPIVQVPRAIVQAGIRAISLRKRFAVHFQENANYHPDVLRSNERHNHIISVLEKLLKTLEPRFQRRNDTQDSLDAEVENFSNKFAALNVEDTEDEDLPGEKLAVSEKAVIFSTKYELEVPKDDVKINTLFAIFCLFDDLLQLRLFLKELWEVYQDGSVTLIAAATITNTAFELAAKLEGELLAEFPSIKSNEDIFNGMYRYLLGDPDLSDEECSKAEGATVGLESIYRVPHLRLSEYMKEYHMQDNPGFLFFEKHREHVKYKPNSDRTKMNFDDRDTEDLQILMELLPECELMTRFFPREDPVLAEDELTRGLCQMMKTGVVPLWLAFATQVYLDIHHTMRSDVGRGLADLQAIASKFKNILDSYDEFALEYPPLRSEQLEDDRIAKILETIDHVIQQDLLGDFKKYLLSTKGAPKHLDPSKKPFQLLARHPLLCGVLAFSLILNMREAGLALINETGSILNTAHLYNALKANNPDMEEWNAMEEALFVHGPENIFLGSPPTTPEAFY